jgi:hypothetical protein
VPDGEFVNGVVAGFLFLIWQGQKVFLVGPEIDSQFPMNP